MAKDRSWVLIDDHRLDAFQKGCEEFLDFAFNKAAIDNKIRCPCRDCECRKIGDREFVHGHLLWRGWDKSYGLGQWVMHLESEEEYRLGHQVCETNEAADFRISEVEEVNHETDGGASGRENMEELLQACIHPDQHESLEESTPEVDDFRKLIEEWCIPLYEGCQENSKLSFVLEFYKIKSRGKMSDKTFSDTLQLIKKIPGLNIPDSFYEVKKLIGKLGCGYVKIDACENDCMLFWKDDIDLDSCRVCNASRWKTSMENQPSSSTTRRKRVPKKVLRHFPLIPRLKRLFICERTSINMRWHAETRRINLQEMKMPDAKANPFVLPSQVLQAFYVEDPRDRPWVVPVVIKPRDNFALKSEDLVEVEDGCYEILSINNDINVIDVMEE
ncbi:PREDICTED: uncharacterized protein LOC105971513 [Erythranthe guttata]|uniref:uncharacterized protein LOC105971513 n=1 Tax=Erythranthe guttata TaxID=4155 RepID=UPI00064DE57D|nr:PREDICTED: uncharacterized protein LOC105971513 [Erythranthe guttata]|eukprot:XP_012851820.1 PREDICTED: uncharacterized protein LOC105971513 [Erythranthe guttata]